MARAPRAGFVSLCGLLIGLSALVCAEGPGTVTGRITDPSGLAVANASVTAVAVNQAAGTRAERPARAASARSDGNGSYTLKLPASGEYRVAFEFEGFERQEHAVTIGDDPITLDVRLELAAIPQTIRVTQTPADNPERESKPGEVVFPADALDRVPVGRSPERAAEMAPGVSGRGPNNALVMAGAFSYGNLFLVDSLPANENTRGLSRPFFIQDAVLETRVSTGAVPAEYGRFQGGVVQTITRSGGNTVAGSIRIGKTLSELLTTPGLKQAELETKLGGLIQQQQQQVQRAQGLDVPGLLRPAHDHAVESLQLRVAGLQGLLDAFKATKDSKDSGAAGEQLSAQARRLEASDVVWQDLFQRPAESTLADEDLSDVTVPQSVFVPTVELYSSRSLASIWQRIHGASTGGTASGLHGTGLAFTKVLPEGTQLSPSVETTITSSTDLGFEVGVTNTGENQEVSITVTLTIPKQPSPIVKKATIDLIDVGETKSVTFKDFPDPPFGEKTSVQVSVKPVQGEKNTANNSAEYPVIFSLG